MGIFDIFGKRFLSGKTLSSNEPRTVNSTSTATVIETTPNMDNTVGRLTPDSGRAEDSATAPQILHTPISNSGISEISSTSNTNLPTPSPEVNPLHAPLASHRSSPRGLMDAPELQQFLQNNHFGLGRHNGSNFRTVEARTLGVKSIISDFQNIVASLSAKKQVQIDRLKDVLQETEGVCDVTSKRLKMAILKFEQEINALHEQIELATSKQGWVQQPVNKYELGFSQGVKAAMDAELLGL